MKRTVKFLAVLTLVLTAAIFAGTAAYASDYEAQADSLGELGLLEGGDTGYELDRVPTRAEAAVMLVRLLGEADEAKSGACACPFTDVPDWAEPYIAFMYANGLTEGTSATTFSPDDDCSAQMFTAFILRALGYSEAAGDFDYQDAEDFASEIGLYCDYGQPDAFLRDNMIALSYASLFRDMKGAKTTLLEKLVSESAVDAGAAEKYLDYYRAYLDFLADNENAPGTNAVRAKTAADIALSIEDIAQTISMTTDTSLVLTGDDFVMKQQNAVTAAGQTTEQTSYYADGWVYVDSPDGNYRYENPMDLSAVVDESDPALQNPFYLIRSIEKTTTGGGTSYAIDYSAMPVNSLLSSSMSEAMGTVGYDRIDFRSAKAVMSFDASGNLRSMQFTVNMGLEMTAGEHVVSTDVTMDVTYTVVATGSAVTVTLPSDLDDYFNLGALS